jgi:CheY-like chemotaxis protein
MNKAGPAIIIEDDEDDRLILEDIFKELALYNQVFFFIDDDQALTFLTLTETKPFLILSDINLPKLNGFELRAKIQNNEALRLRCIPYLFFTTAASHQAVTNAYSKSIHRFFVKPAKYADIERTLPRIVEYWQECKAANYI